MKKSLIALAIMAALAGESVRARTRDISFTYRMGAGFPGDINRTHPVSVLPANMHTTQPVRLYGDAGIYDAATSTVRGFQAGDSGLLRMAGVLVRSFPVQTVTGGMNNPLGAGVPPAGPAVVDVMEEGYIMVKCNNFAVNAPTKDGLVYVWCAATSGNNIQGGFTAVANAGNAAAIANARWNGPADANGIAEMVVWKA